MSRRMWGLVLMLIGGELLGLLLGQWFFSLFEKTVPPLAVSQFNMSAAHAAFLFRGAVGGLLFALWGGLCVLLGSMFRGTKPLVRHP